MEKYSRLEIDSACGIEFYLRIARFSYESFLTSGSGVVMIHQELFESNSQKINATVVYVPYDEDDALLSGIIAGRVPEYNPKEQCVLCMVDSKGKGAIITLSAEDIGSTPDELYRTKLIQDTGVPFHPGAVLRMIDAIGEQPPGYVVYLKSEKAEMLLARARSDVDGDIVPTGEHFKAHIDFAEVFVDTDIVTAPEKLLPQNITFSYGDAPSGELPFRAVTDVWVPYENCSSINRSHPFPEPCPAALRVLMIDDLAIRRCVEMLIFQKTWQQRDYFFYGTDKTDEALDILDEVEINLVILAYRLFPLNGIGFAKHLRSRSRFKNIPILFCSASPFEWFERAGVVSEHDHFAFVGKPFGYTEFVATVENLLKESGVHVPQRRQPEEKSG